MASGRWSAADERQNLRSRGGEAGGIDAAYEPHAPRGGPGPSSARPKSRQNLGPPPRSSYGLSPSSRQSGLRPASREAGPLLSSSQNLKRETASSRGYGTVQRQTSRINSGQEYTPVAAENSASQYPYHQPPSSGRFAGGPTRPSTQQHAPSARNFRPAAVGSRPASSGGGGSPYATSSRHSQPQYGRAVTAAATQRGFPARAEYAPAPPQHAPRESYGGAEYAQYEETDYRQSQYGYGPRGDAGSLGPRAVRYGGHDQAPEYGDYDQYYGQGGGPYYPGDDYEGGAGRAGVVMTAPPRPPPSRDSRGVHPFAQPQPQTAPAVAAAEPSPVSSIMLSEYMARMEIIPRGDSRGGGSRSGSRAGSRACSRAGSAGSESFPASNLTDADCMPAGGGDFSELTRGIDDDDGPDGAPLSRAKPPQRPSDGALRASGALARHSLSRLRPATTAALLPAGGPPQAAQALSLQPTLVVDLSGLHERLFSPTEGQDLPSSRRQHQHGSQADGGGGGGFAGGDADADGPDADDGPGGDRLVRGMVSQQRRVNSASAVQVVRSSPWGEVPVGADRPPSRQRPPPESLDLFAGGAADPRGLALESREQGMRRPMTAAAATGPAHGEFHFHGAGAGFHGVSAGSQGLQQSAWPLSFNRGQAPLVPTPQRSVLEQQQVDRISDDIYAPHDHDVEEY